MNILDKLDDIIYEPIKLMTDWAREPLRRSEHKRTVEKQTALIEKEAEMRFAEKMLDADLDIKRKTEVERILVDIEEWRKDKELERMKAVSEAIMKYQKELTRLNVSAITAIGSMQLELRERAQVLVYERTIKYKELQDLAICEAARDLQRIERDFSDNPQARDILVKAVDKRLAHIIDTAHNFLLELNADIKLLNQSISLLAEQGQGFVKQHLDKFYVIEPIAQESQRIERQ